MCTLCCCVFIGNTQPQCVVMHLDGSLGWCRRTGAGECGFPVPLSSGSAASAWEVWPGLASSPPLAGTALPFQETEDPVVEWQENETALSPSHPGGSSLASGDLGDISSSSSRASGLQHTSSGGSSAWSVTRSGASSGRGPAPFRGGVFRGAEPGAFALPGAKKPRCVQGWGWAGRDRVWAPLQVSKHPQFCSWGIPGALAVQSALRLAPGSARTPFEAIHLRG